MPTGDPMFCNCVTAWWGTVPPPPCPVHIGLSERVHEWATPAPVPRLGDGDVERIARRVAELMKGAHDLAAPGGPVCQCGQPSTHESGWCGACVAEASPWR